MVYILLYDCSKLYKYELDGNESLPLLLLLLLRMS